MPQTRLFSHDSTHWYDPKGIPMHLVSAADGKLRPATLRDARKLGLFPSVTNILAVVAKPELTLWLQEQAVIAALTLPREAGESEDAFAKRVAADSRTTRDTAADFGVSFHQGADRVARTLEVDPADPAAPWLNHYRDWFQANCVRLHWTERVLVSPAHGYAGTADLLIEHQTYGLTLIDLKTQSVKSASGPSMYRSWSYQLAAYRQALGMPVACLNLIMNSKEPHPPVEALWSEEDMNKGWDAFQAALTLWQIEKNFSPTSR